MVTCPLAGVAATRTYGVARRAVLEPLLVEDNDIGGAAAAPPPPPRRLRRTGGAIFYGATGKRAGAGKNACAGVD